MDNQQRFDLLMDDIRNGFTKTDLENLIGLAQNSLSNLMSGKRSLSKKLADRIDAWNKSEKPKPKKYRSKKFIY